MPNPLTLALAAGLAGVGTALAAGLALLFLGRSWRAAHASITAIGGIVSVGAAVYVCCPMLVEMPHWPPKDDQARFLYVLLPVVLAVEVLAAIPKSPRWMAWVLRGVIAFGAARLLLHNTLYLVESDPDNPPWPTQTMVLILGGMGGALLAVWGALACLIHRTGDRFAPLALSGVCAGSAATLMMSGYLTGGQVGLPIAFALAGGALVWLVVPQPRNLSGLVGIGMVGLFGLLIMGRFFGKLTTPHAAILFAAPLLCWLPELPGVRGLWPWLRGVLRVVVVMVPVVIVGAHAKQTLDEDSKSNSRPGEPTRDDYGNFQP